MKVGMMLITALVAASTLCLAQEEEIILRPPDSRLGVAGSEPVQDEITLRPESRLGRPQPEAEPPAQPREPLQPDSRLGLGEPPQGVGAERDFSPPPLPPDKSVVTVTRPPAPAASRPTASAAVRQPQQGAKQPQVRRTATKVASPPQVVEKRVIETRVLTTPWYTPLGIIASTLAVVGVAWLLVVLFNRRG
jgi:hypothetical protein